MAGKLSNVQPTNFYRRSDGAVVISNGAGFNFMLGIWDQGTEIDATLAFGDPVEDGPPAGPFANITWHVGLYQTLKLDKLTGLTMAVDDQYTFRTLMGPTGNIGNSTSNVDCKDLNIYGDVSGGNGPDWGIQEDGAATFGSNLFWDVGGNFTCTSVNSEQGYSFNGTQVVSGQQPAIADATGPLDVVAQLNLALAALRAHGLIAT